MVCLMAGCMVAFAGQSAIVLECERFEKKGGWQTDSQFMDQMGSPYLLAHGLGKCVADAETSFVVSNGARYCVWARTMNWTAPWSKAEGAGVFQLVIDGKALPAKLGSDGDEKWQWWKAGEIDLAGGNHRVALRDLTGFDGRCDAICLVEGTAGEPDRRLSSAAAPIADVTSADLVVCGGGIAGICAAVTAARLGLKVALVEARPILGGANSREVRVHLGGLMKLSPYEALGDVLCEFAAPRCGNAAPADCYRDDLKAKVVEAEKNLSLLLDTRIVAARMQPGTAAGMRGIAEVVGVRAADGRKTVFRAPLFVDCTGDGAVGYLAGADFRMGREGRDETGEDMAPPHGDKMTMGSSVQWYAEKDAAPSAFEIRPWMLTFAESSCVHGTRGDWDWETGMWRDQIVDFERIRDYGLLVAFSNWAYLKSKSEKRGKYADWSLSWVAYVAGKRESRRLMGDVVLTKNDIMQFVEYPDGTCATTWAIDLHYPLSAQASGFAGEAFRSKCTHVPHYAYPIPYRCFYSRNVNNLFMAGRNISVTHVALGTVRVMRTTGMMGEVVGRAASICRRHRCLPRDVYNQHLEELKTLLRQSVGKLKNPTYDTYNGAYLLIGDPHSGTNSLPKGIW